MLEDYQNYQIERAECLKNLRARLQKAMPQNDWPFLLELGCGHGHFLSAMAERDKGVHRNYLGVDKNRERLARGKKKSDRTGTGIIWMNAYVADMIECWPEGRVVEDVFVLFPDPWPKTRQQKNRYVNAELLVALAKVVKKGGHFHFRSDHKGYFDQVMQLLAASPHWQLDAEATWPQGLPITVFEKHHPIYYSCIAKLK